MYLRLVRATVATVTHHIHKRYHMPQLTLFSDPRSKSLSLSPKQAKTTNHSRRASGHSQSGGAGLWDLHHEEEDMAASNRARAKAKAEGTEVPMNDDGDHEGENEVGEARKREGSEEGEKPKGQPSGGGGRGKKRSHSPEGGGVAGSRDTKKHKNAYEIKGKVATAEVAAKVDADPPLDQLMRLLGENTKDVGKCESVVYWMRMEDIRIEDNTALAKASEKAQELKVPLIVLYVLSPGDYKMHDRAPKKIDFILRNLRWLKPKFEELNIPFHTISFDRRLQIPRRLVTEVFPDLRAKHVYCNIEYEVDELRRDIATVKRGRDAGIDVVPVHDRLVVPPGKVLSKAGKPISIYSPWQRAWADILSKDKSYLEMADLPKANDASIKKHDRFANLFTETEIPEYIEGFKLDDEGSRTVFPEGTDVAKQLLDRFLHTKARLDQFKLVSPLSDGAEKDDKHSRLAEYQTGRNLVNGDHSSRLSPYLAAGVISGRMVLNEAKKRGSKGRLETGRDTGLGMWVQEVAWRDFYNHVMATWPRVSMGRPFLEKFADVQWEVSEENLQRWKDGKTGYPIVDAAMRACKARGWMENRVRMVTASFLVKELMLDWRLGEKHFMESFCDGDLAANNGGWQWTASTGTDPQPYFRIFNSLTQSEKCDPNGDYIRYWVPELKNLKGKTVHDPYHNMPSNEFKKLGYPAPIVDHKKARERALFRYKNVGEKEDGS